jgi:hypothetical protein
MPPHSTKDRFNVSGILPGIHQRAAAHPGGEAVDQIGWGEK